MSWKGVKEENHTKICIEKCASVHGFVCMRYGMKIVTLIQKVLDEPAYALEWKSMPGLNRLEVQMFEK